MFPPLRWLFRLGGVFPEMTIKDHYFVCMMVAWQLHYLFSATCHLFEEGSYNDIALGVHVLNDVVDCILGLLILAKVHLLRHTFTALVRTCLEPQHTAENKSVRRSQILMFTVFCVLLIARALARSFGSGEVILHFDFVMGLLYTPTMLFMMLVRHLTCRFSRLNHQLRGIVEEVQTHNLPVHDLQQHLANAFRMHIYLRHVKDSTNSFFGMFNAITTINRVVYLTVALYYLILSISDPNASLIIIDVLVILSVFSSQVSLCDFCYRCSEKAKETVCIAHGIVDVDTPREILEEIEDFSLTMYNDPLKFSAAGIFNLDRGMITKSTMATVTCLIIAIQLTNFEARQQTSMAANTTESIQRVTSVMTTLLG